MMQPSARAASQNADGTSGNRRGIWCCFDLDASGALAHGEAWLPVRRRAVEHATILEGEL